MTTGASSGKQGYDAYGTSFELMYYSLRAHFGPTGGIIVFQCHISSSKVYAIGIPNNRNISVILERNN